MKGGLEVIRCGLGVIPGGRGGDRGCPGTQGWEEGRGGRGTRGRFKACGIGTDDYSKFRQF